MSGSLPDLAELEIAELAATLEAAGTPRFHATQIYRWIHHRAATHVEGMTDLSKALRNRLTQEFRLTTPGIVGD